MTGHESGAAARDSAAARDYVADDETSARSARVALVTGVLLVGALAAIVGIGWRALAHHGHLGIALLIGVTLYAALTSAVLARRISDPKLDLPALAVIAVIVFWIIRLIGAVASDASSEPSDGSTSESSSTSSGMGRGSAIAGTILALLFYGGGVAGLILLAKHP